MGLPTNQPPTTGDPTTDPMGSSRFHNVLVLTDNIQHLPSLLIVIILVFLASSLALAWPLSDVPILYLLFATVNWVVLWLLPRMERSYGPEKASTLALAIVNWVILLPLGLLNAPLWLALAIMVAVTLVVVYSTWIEPFNLGLTRESLTTPKLSAMVRPITILHLGDLHMEHPSPRERDLNERIKTIQPDIIVFSGDFVNISYTDDDTVKDEIRALIREWNAPLGAYAVPGTYTVEAVSRVREFVEGLNNITLLLDRWQSIDTPGGKVHILGMVTRHILETDRATLDSMMEQAPTGGFKLLLTHAPDVAYDADRHGFDLYLCGHTHGGQIRFPLIGAVFSGSHLGMDFVMGRRDLTNTTVYTTRGIGLEGMGAPRARFLCPPEIILWSIRSADQTGDLATDATNGANA